MRDKINTCHPDLIRVYNRAKKEATSIEFTCICGHRTKEEQDKAFDEGKSKLKFPNGKHNKSPSWAMDLAPIQDGKINWNDILGFRKLAALILECAKKENVKIRWGGDWNMNNIDDEKFKDLPHFELTQ